MHVHITGLLNSGSAWEDGRVSRRRAEPGIIAGYELRLWIYRQGAETGRARNPDEAPLTLGSRRIRSPGSPSWSGTRTRSSSSRAHLNVRTARRPTAQSRDQARPCPTSTGGSPSR